MRVKKCTKKRAARVKLSIAFLQFSLSSPGRLGCLSSLIWKIYLIVSRLLGWIARLMKKKLVTVTKEDNGTEI